MLFPLAPPVNTNILEGADGGPTTNAKVAFGPSIQLLQESDNNASDGNQAAGSRRRAAKPVVRPEYFDTHERMIRQAKQKAEKEKRRKERKKLDEAQEHLKQIEDEISARTAQEKQETVANEVQQQLATAEANSPESGGGNKRKRDSMGEDPSASSFTPTSEFNQAIKKDYQGRGILFCKETFPGASYACKPPTRPQLVLKGHESGVQSMCWVTPNAHLLLSADLQGHTYLWHCFGEEKGNRIAKYVGHQGAAKNVAAEHSGETFTTSSEDGFIRHWDTERGELLTSLHHKAQLACAAHVYHPSEENQNLILAAFGKSAYLFDLRAHARGTTSSGSVKEWHGHTQPLMSVTFVDEGKKFITTSEDKSVRTWDFRVTIPIQTIADVSMHAIPHMADHPSDRTVAGQSLDNKVVVLSNDGNGKLRFLKDRALTGHVVSGTACQVAFSNDGEYLSSGDSTGQLFIWKYSTGKLAMKKPFRAHQKTLVAHMWHPHHPSLIATSSWDGLIKLWQ